MGAIFRWRWQGGRFLWLGRDSIDVLVRPFLSVGERSRSYVHFASNEANSEAPSVCGWAHSGVETVSEGPSFVVAAESQPRDCPETSVSFLYRTLFAELRFCQLNEATSVRSRSDESSTRISLSASKCFVPKQTLVAKSLGWWKNRNNNTLGYSARRVPCARRRTEAI